jgi:deoxycytidylate deaminase
LCFLNLKKNDLTIIFFKLQMFDNQVLDNLKKTAMKSPVNNRHSAALVKNNDIISKSHYNKFIKEIKVIKDNTIYLHNFTIHAEINVICNYYDKKNIKGMDLIVIRINNIGTQLKNSRPCNSCITKLKKIGIRKVFYSNSGGIIVSEFIQDMKFLHVCSGENNLNMILS